METPKTVDDKVVEGIKKRYNTQQKDADALKAKPIKVENLLNDMNDIPRSQRVVGPIGKTSVRPSKTDENTLHGGDGKDMSGTEKGE